MGVRYTHVVGMLHGDGLFHYERWVAPSASHVLACNEKAWGKLHQPEDRIAVNPRAYAVTCLWCAAGKAR